MMAIDPEMLAILACPKTHGELEVVDLPEEVRLTLVEKYREYFRDEEPVAEQGLYCRESQLVYPVLRFGDEADAASDIPIMLEDDALPASVLEPAPGD